MNKIMISVVVICGLLQAQGPSRRDIPLNQDITLGDIAVSLVPYSNPLSTGLLVNVTTATPAARMVVVATILTADGSRQQYTAVALWMPSSDNQMTVALVTKTTVSSVLSAMVIPVAGEQIHGL